MSIFPKAQSLLPHGSLVMYENDGVPLLALVAGFKKEKYLLFNERGREVELPPNRLVELPGRGPGTQASQGEKVQFLEEVRTAATALVPSLNLEEIWSFVIDEPREYADKELVSLYLGTADLNQLLAMRLALLADRIFFRRSKGGFEPRSAEIIDELRKAEEARQRKVLAQKRTSEFFRRRIEELDAAIPPELEANIALLEQCAAFGSNLDGPRLKEANELLALIAEAVPLALGGPPEEQAFKVLLGIGYFHPDTNLSLIRHNPPRVWPEEVLAHATGLTVPSRDHLPHRLDLTSVRSFTIDDEVTKDMDDALSLERTEGGYRVGVHITDVAAVVPPGSPLDIEAKRRATSIYCLDHTINMFPDELAEQKLSLREGEDRPCLSCICELDEGYRVVHTTIVPTVIRVTRRLSYGETDELLEQGDYELTHLYNFAAQQEEARIRAGGARIEKREAIVYPNPDGTLRLVEIDESSAARSLVGEMMVFCNQHFAEYAVAHGIPLPFRGQETPEEQSPPDVPPGPAFDYALRSRLKRSTVGTTPLPHATLGLRAYSQVSSPIRRYLDLCAQRQLLSFLETGHPCYTKGALDQIIEEGEQPLSNAFSVSKETRRYWFLRYLGERAKRDPLITATVIRSDHRGTLAELDEVYIPAPVKPPSPVRPGDPLKLKIVRVDPRADYLRLEVVR